MRAAGRGYGAGTVSIHCCIGAFQNFAMPVVPWPRVPLLAGMRPSLAFFRHASSRSMVPSSGGLLSSSAELIASTGTRMRSSCGDGL